ncbi:hypothetical protein LTR95_012629, partial [Oleoguttula sp. CCFEE 5521]
IHVIEHMWARPRIMGQFLSAVNGGMTAPGAAHRYLLPLKLRAWTYAWRLGVIDKNSRDAVLDHKLTMQLMHSRFFAPIPELPLPMSQKFNDLPIQQRPSASGTTPPTQHLRTILIGLASPSDFLQRLSILQADLDNPNRLHPLLHIPATPVSLLFNRLLNKVIIDLCTRLVDSATFQGNVLPYIAHVEILTGLPPLPFRDLEHCQQGLNGTMGRLEEIIEQAREVAGVMGEVVISEY